MQILELDCDPWREQYFPDITSHMGIFIPGDDRDAYNLYPEHRWTYDRFLVARSQGLESGLHDAAPARYPVFSKAITKLIASREKNVDSRPRTLFDDRDYRQHCGPGSFWMNCLTGERLSSDLAVVGGEVAWCRHTSAVIGRSHGLDYWVVEASSRPRLDRYCNEWIRLHLSGFTGMVNLETMGGRITEVHLRSADQWSDLYGRKWLDALVRLHQRGSWDLVDSDRAEAYSVVLLGKQGRNYDYPTLQQLATHRAAVGISSIKATPDESRATGGSVATDVFRLAVINTFNLDVGLRVRAALATVMGADG